MDLNAIQDTLRNFLPHFIVHVGAWIAQQSPPVQNTTVSVAQQLHLECTVCSRT